MPITYTLEADGQYVLERFDGIVRIGDLGAHWMRLLADPAARRAKRTVALLQLTGMPFSGAELHEAVLTVLVPRLEPDERWRTAVVVQKTEQFGVSRQFQVFAEVKVDVQIFDNVDDAVAWVMRG